MGFLTILLTSFFVSLGAMAASALRVFFGFASSCGRVGEGRAAVVIIKSESKKDVSAFFVAHAPMILAEQCVMTYLSSASNALHCDF